MIWVVGVSGDMGSYMVGGSWWWELVVGVGGGS